MLDLKISAHEGIVGAVMTIHTFGEYLDFHPHLHALVADGLFTASGMFHVMPDAPLKPLEELFRLRVLSFLVGKELLSKQRADMLMSWKHSGFNVHRSRRVEFDERDDLVRLAQYTCLPAGRSFAIRSPSKKCMSPPTAPSSTVPA
jgi:hypothetical protein